MSLSTEMTFLDAFRWAHVALLGAAAFVALGTTVLTMLGRIVCRQPSSGCPLVFSVLGGCAIVVVPDIGGMVDFEVAWMPAALELTLLTLFSVVGNLVGHSGGES